MRGKRKGEERKMKREKMVEIWQDEKGEVQQRINCNTWEYGLIGYVILENFTAMLNELGKENEAKHVVTTEEALRMIKKAYRKERGKNEC